MAENSSGYCGCCEERKKRIPVDLSNPPGLSALRYRVGTHSQFKADMTETISHKYALRKLTIREDDDLSISMLDSWATIADVLSFYQERIANEGYLRTATERRSVLELARTIGYELKPGVAASTPLAFMIEEAPGTPIQSLVEEGTKVLSVPGQNEKLQTFETVETIDAKTALNDLKPLQLLPKQVKRGLKELYLKGINLNLAPGDAILLVGVERLEDSGNENWDFRILQTVTLNKEKDYTCVTWKEGLGHGSPYIVEPAKRPQVFVFRQRAAFFGYNAPDWTAMPVSVKIAYDEKYRANHVNKTESAINEKLSMESASSQIKSEKYNGPFADWPGFNSIADNATIHLDAIYPKILSNSWIVLAGQHGGEKPIYYVELYRAKEVELDAQTDFTISGKTTKIKLDTLENLQETNSKGEVKSAFKRRETTVYCVNELLELTDAPLTEPFWGNRITFDHKVPELKKAQKIIVVGKRAKMQIVEKRNMAVTPSDGLKEKDVLMVLAPPTVDAQGYSTWHLLNEKGVEVTVRVEPENIIPIGDGTALIRGEVHLVLLDGVKSKLLEGGKASSNYTIQIVETLPVIDGLGNLRWHLKAIETETTTKKEKTFEGYAIDESDRLVFEPPDKDDESVSEVATISELSDSTGTTIATLAIPENRDFALANVYALTTVHVYANVALATHGEKVLETLGSGDGSQINQNFLLRKPPLTYVSASTPSGAKSTLKVYVNDLQWREEATFFGSTPTYQAYTVKIEDNGDTSVNFGDGKTGARLPSGTENITAKYRSGIGFKGAVAANKLTLLTKRPLGIRSVTNPMPASGAASPEKIEDARVNAPSTVLTLNRIVSLKDYEDFARTYSGIAKAIAKAEWLGEDYIVHLIVAPADAKPLDVTTTLYKNLQDAIKNSSAYGKKMSIESFTPLYFNIEGKIYIDSHFLPEEVKANVESAIQNAFSFGKRTFKQPVATSDVIAVIQEVPGIEYVDIDRLFLMDGRQIELKDLAFKDDMLLMINPKGINLEVKV